MRFHFNFRPGNWPISPSFEECRYQQRPQQYYTQWKKALVNLASDYIYAPNNAIDVDDDWLQLTYQIKANLDRPDKEGGCGAYLPKIVSSRTSNCLKQVSPTTALSIGKWAPQTYKGWQILGFFPISPWYQHLLEI